MSIEKKKIERIADEIIAASLKLGYVPTSDEVIAQIGEAIQQSRPSEPLFQHEPVSSLSSNQLNADKEALRRDFDLLLASIYEIYEKAMEQSRKIRSERERQERRLDELQANLERLSLLQATPGYLAGYINPITAVSLFDSDATDCEIDILNRQLCLPAKEMQVMRQYKATLVTPGLVANGDLDIMTRSGALNWTAYTSREKKQGQTGVAIEIDIDLYNPINRLELNLPMLKPVEVRVEEAQYLGSYTTSSLKTTSGLFSCPIKNSTRFIRLTLTKSEADKYDSGAGKYFFYFILGALYLLDNAYLGSAQFQTKAISVPEDADLIAFLAEDRRPPSTRIIYEASPDQAEWFEIKNGDTIPLNAVSRNLHVTLANDEQYTLETFRATQFASSIYKLGKIDDRSMTNVRLFKGSNCWREERLVISTPIVGYVYQKTFLDARAANLTTATRYLPISRTQPASLYNQYPVPGAYAIAATTTVERAEASTERYPIAHSYPLVIYLNGRIIYTGVGTEAVRDVTWNFISGTNRIEMYLHVNAPNTIVGESSLSLLTVDLGFDVTRGSKIVYASETVAEKLTLFDLEYNSVGRKNAFAVEEVSDGTNIYINTSDVYVPHQIVYDTINRTNKQLYIRGQLFSPDPALTPIVQFLEVRYA